MSLGWYYNELRQVGTDYESLEEVMAYDETMQLIRDIKKEIEAIINNVNLSSEHNLLEIGIGTGEFAIGLASRCKKVYAIDVSKMMLEYAREKAQKQDINNIEFIHAGFLSYEHIEKDLDVVVTQLALHHLSDFWKMIAIQKIYDMLKPGGFLYLKDVIFSFDHTNYKDFLNNFLAELLNKSNENTVLETEEHIREEYSTFSWIIEGMLKRAGFEIVSMEYEDGFIATYVCKKV